VPNLRPWSPEDPYLYRLEATLLDANGPLDRTTAVAGFRTLVTDERAGNFLLNGRAYFLRGCGYDSLEPIHGSPPPDKRVYVERLRNLKQYGFNAVRFLSHTPLREFFEAADEVGFLVQTEGEWFLGGTPMAPETAALFTAQVPRMIGQVSAIVGHPPAGKTEWGRLARRRGVSLV
jgi:beta-galactosidase/beta-glucuronidase